MRRPRVSARRSSSECPSRKFILAFSASAFQVSGQDLLLYEVADSYLQPYLAVNSLLHLHDCLTNKHLPAPSQISILLCEPARLLQKRFPPIDDQELQSTAKVFLVLCLRLLQSGGPSN